MNEQLHKLYGEKIILWRNLAGRWDRQECEYRELAEAQAAMDVVWALLGDGEAGATEVGQAMVACVLTNRTPAR